MWTSEWIITFICIIVGSYFKGKMDTIMFHNRVIGWKNKWKLTPDGKLKYYTKKDWYYFKNYPTYEESFPYSSTVLVCFTDAWHRNQFIMLRCYYLGIGIHASSLIFTGALVFLIFPVIYGIGFYFSYEKKKL